MTTIIIITIIIWQSQSWANPCALIGSFSVRILQYRPLPWKQSKPFIFVLEQSWQIQTLQPQLRKKKCEYCHSSQQNKRKFYQDFKDRWRRWTFSERVLLSWRSGNFWCRNWNRHHQKPKAIDNFINQQKSVNTNKKMATDMNTILCYMEAIFMKNEKIESLPASELDHLLSKFCLHTCKKYGEEYQPATVSSFQRSIQRYLSEPYCKIRRISRTPSLENKIWEKKLKRDP